MKKMLFISILNLILLVLCFTFVTFAWLSTNKTTTGGGLNIKVRQNEMNLNYTIYKYDSSSKTFMTTQSFALPAYDMILTDRNIHTSLILKLEISGDVILQQKDVNLNFLCSDSQSNTMSLSNAVCFKVGIFSIASDDAAFIYTEAERQLNSSSSIKFLNATKNTSINYLLHNYNATNGNLTVYIQIDYDADLIDNFETITNDDFETAINFQSDIYELNLIAGD